MIYKLVPSVKMTISSNKISLSKGIWNFSLVEILKDDYNFVWNDLITLFSKIFRENEIYPNEISPEIEKIITELLNYQMIYKHVSKKSYDLLVCNDVVYNYLLNLKNESSFFKNMPRKSFLNLENVDFSNFNTILILYFNDSLIELRNLNEKLVRAKKDITYSLLEGEFIHIMNRDEESKSACFECYYERIISRMNSENYFRFIELQKNFSEKIKDSKDDLSLLVLMISILEIVLKNSSIYLDGFGMNNRLLKLFVPTFEINYDYLLKIPFCKVCGSESKMIAHENNLDLMKFLRVTKAKNDKN